MKINIPGYKTLDLKYLLLDYNGTIATDGEIPVKIKEKLVSLAETFEIYVLTADTHGTAISMCEELPLEIQTFPSDTAMQSKLAIAS
ncbi:MAG TPA: ATPase P, partial [Tetragenococcus sp.]|nr:ATPase P [Tetragenococcus sp.]